MIRVMLYPAGQRALTPIFETNKVSVVVYSAYSVAERYGGPKHGRVRTCTNTRVHTTVWLLSLSRPFSIFPFLARSLPVFLSLFVCLPACLSVCLHLKRMENCLLGVSDGTDA